MQSPKYKRKNLYFCAPTIQKIAQLSQQNTEIFISCVPKSYFMAAATHSSVTKILECRKKIDPTPTYYLCFSCSAIALSNGEPLSLPTRRILNPRTTCPGE